MDERKEEPSKIKKREMVSGLPFSFQNFGAKTARKYMITAVEPNSKTKAEPKEGTNIWY